MDHRCNAVRLCVAATQSSFPFGCDDPELGSVRHPAAGSEAPGSQFRIIAGAVFMHDPGVERTDQAWSVGMIQSSPTAVWRGRVTMYATPSAMSSGARTSVCW